MISGALSSELVVVLEAAAGAAAVGETRSDGVSPTSELVVDGVAACWPPCSLSCCGACGSPCLPLCSLRFCGACGSACCPPCSLSCGAGAGCALAAPAAANIIAATQVITAVLRVRDAIWWCFMRGHLRGGIDSCDRMAGTRPLPRPRRHPACAIGHSRGQAA